MGLDESGIQFEDLDIDLGELSHDDFEEAYVHMTDEERAEVDALLKVSPSRSLMPHQEVPLHLPWWSVYLLVGGRGCVRGDTLIFDPATKTETDIKELARLGQEIYVASITKDGIKVGRTDGPPFMKGTAPLYEVTTETGKTISVTDQHRFLTSFGWRHLSSLRVGNLLASGLGPSLSTSELSLLGSPLDALRSMSTISNSIDDYRKYYRSYGQLLPLLSNSVPNVFPLLSGVPSRSRGDLCLDGTKTLLTRNHLYRRPCPLSKNSFYQDGLLPEDEVCRKKSWPYEQFPQKLETQGPSHERSFAFSQNEANPFSLTGSNELLFHSYNDPIRWERILSIEYVGVEDFYDMTVPVYENYYAQGFWNHNTGKTVAGAFEAISHLRKNGAKARIGIGAPTNADTRDTCMEGETGLITMFPHEFTQYNRSLGEARHIGGGIVKAMGTEKPKRWNGPQWSMIWFDELALCNQDAWNDANLGLRLGDRPYAVCTTTPKARKWVKALALDKTTYVPQYIDAETGKRRLPTTFDNEYLPIGRVNWLRNKYGNSRLGQQELQGLFIDDVAGAMWSRDNIIHITDSAEWPRFQRIIVAIDPAGSVARKTADENAQTEEDKQNQRKNADTAISVVALGADSRFYVLAVKSGQWSPSEWAAESIKMFQMFRADKIIAEKNYGGDMVESNIRNYDGIDKDTGYKLVGKNLPIKLVTASRGKHIRAEPVCTLYEQHRVIHCRRFGPAEDQMCAFVDADDNEGADMVDAVVWAITELGGLANHDYGTLITDPDPRLQAFVVNMK